MIIRRLEALFGFKVDTSQFKKATSAIDNFAENANTAMGVLVGHFAFQAVKDFVDSTTEAMANVGKTRVVRCAGVVSARRRLFHILPHSVR
jgi:hypothetical protein